MNRAWVERTIVTLPMPDPHVLAAFGDDAPLSIISTYFSVLRQYPALHPTPAPSDIRHAMVEAIVRYGRGANELVHELALAIRTDFQPRAAVEDVMDYLHLIGSDDVVVQRTALRLVDWLLEADTTHDCGGVSERSHVEKFADG